MLKLSELDSLVQKLNTIQDKLKEKWIEQEQAKKLGSRKNREAARLEKLSLITGKSFDLEATPEKIQVKEVEAEISKLNAEVIELEKRISEGIPGVKFPVKNPTPEVSKGNAIFFFEEGVYENAINYLKQALSMSEELEIDNVVFRSDKIVVRGKSEVDEATDSLMNAAQSIWALGSIMSGKVPKEMRETISSLNQSKHKQLWEFIGSRGNISLENTYENFKLTDATEKKRARTFYSQLESLRTPPLAIGDGKGNYQLTMYGRLVWTSYKRTYAVPEEKIEEAERVSEVQEVGKEQPREPTKKPSQTALQNFLEKVLLKEGD